VSRLYVLFNYIKMREISASELGRQLMKPTGQTGLIVAEKMNAANSKMYDFVLSQMAIASNDKILEIGFGNGKMINRFFENNPNIAFFGIDFSETMCLEARKLNKQLVADGKLHISCQNSLRLSFPDDEFDTLVAINTIYFWDDLNSQLAELNRVLRKGGQLVIGYRPGKAMENLPFTNEVFKHYDPIEFRTSMERLGFDTISETIKASEIKGVDGRVLEIEDICLIVKKTNKTVRR
jgi:SAM-dependent methyltransferase